MGAQVSFDPDEIERERGVILEEWRLGLGAASRIQDAQLPVLLGGSRYAVRSPIGLPDVIRTASPDRLKQFYRDWYRPDLMAVVAVGDFDPAAVEAAIVAHFGPLPATVAPRPLPAVGVPDRPGTRVAVTTDKEITATSVGVYRWMPARDQRTVGAYRQTDGRAAVRQPAVGSPGRNREQTWRAVLAARTSRSLFVRSAEVTVLNALVPDGGVTRGLTALLAEIERVAQSGFTQTELDRQKLGSITYLDRAVVERDKDPSQPSPRIHPQLPHDEPIPGIVTSMRWRSVSCRRSRSRKSTRLQGPGRPMATDP